MYVGKLGPKFVTKDIAVVGNTILDGNKTKCIEGFFLDD